MWCGVVISEGVGPLELCHSAFAKVHWGSTHLYINWSEHIALSAICTQVGYKLNVMLNVQISTSFDEMEYY